MTNFNADQKDFPAAHGQVYVETFPDGDILLNTSEYEDPTWLSPDEALALGEDLVRRAQNGLAQQAGL